MGTSTATTEPSPPPGLRFEAGDIGEFSAWIKEWVAWRAAPLQTAHDALASELNTLKSAHTSLEAQFAALEQRLASAATPSPSPASNVSVTTGTIVDKGTS